MKNTFSKILIALITFYIGHFSVKGQAKSSALIIEKPNFKFIASPSGDTLFIWQYKIYNSQKYLAAEGYTNSDSVKFGWWKEYFFDGKIAAFGKYENGKKNGPWTHYQPTGKVEKIGAYLNNLPEGAWSFFDEKGKLASQGNYINGKQNGHWIYFKKGVINKEGTYKMGLPVGEWKYYNDKGKLEKTLTY